MCGAASCFTLHLQVELGVGGHSGETFSRIYARPATIRKLKAQTEDSDGRVGIEHSGILDLTEEV